MKYFIFTFSGHYMSGYGTVTAPNKKDALVKAKIKVGSKGFDRESTVVKEIGLETEMLYNGDY